MLRIISLLFVFLFSSTASALDYYWTEGYTPGTFPSASAACAAAVAIQGGEGGAYAGIVMLSAVAADCLYTGEFAPTPTHITYVSRSGDGCPVDTTYNAETGSCDGPPACMDIRGDSAGYKNGSTLSDGC